MKSKKLLLISVISVLVLSPVTAFAQEGVQCISSSELSEAHHKFNRAVHAISDNRAHAPIPSLNTLVGLIGPEHSAASNRLQTIRLRRQLVAHRDLPEVRDALRYSYVHIVQPGSQQSCVAGTPVSPAVQGAVIPSVSPSELAPVAAAGEGEESPVIAVSPSEHVIREDGPIGSGILLDTALDPAHLNQGGAGTANDSMPEPKVHR